MGRIKSSPSDPDQPRIDEGKVAEFFEERARKIPLLGSTRAVIYQDRHPDLAERRDRAEKAKLLPLLGLDGSQHALDVGCGTGRWAEAIEPEVAMYHGVDLSTGLIEYASRRFSGSSHMRFSVLSATNLSLERLGTDVPFHTIVCAGILIYLNDEGVQSVADGLVRVASADARILVREPVGVDRRLTLQDHYSEDLSQTYHAIYRTPEELSALFFGPLREGGFRLMDSGEVYDEIELNNRSDTRQTWYLLGRGT